MLANMCYNVVFLGVESLDEDLGSWQTEINQAGCGANTYIILAGLFFNFCYENSCIILLVFVLDHYRNDKSKA